MTETLQAKLVRKKFQLSIVDRKFTIRSIEVASKYFNTEHLERVVIRFLEQQDYDNCRMWLPSFKKALGDRKLNIELEDMIGRKIFLEFRRLLARGDYSGAWTFSLGLLKSKEKEKDLEELRNSLALRGNWQELIELSYAFRMDIGTYGHNLKEKLNLFVDYFLEKGDNHKAYYLLIGLGIEESVPEYRKFLEYELSVLRRRPEMVDAYNFAIKYNFSKEVCGVIVRVELDRRLKQAKNGEISEIGFFESEILDRKMIVSNNLLDLVVEGLIAITCQYTYKGSIFSYLSTRIKRMRIHSGYKEDLLERILKAAYMILGYGGNFSDQESLIKTRSYVKRSRRMIVLDSALCTIIDLYKDYEKAYQIALIYGNRAVKRNFARKFVLTELMKPGFDIEKIDKICKKHKISSQDIAI